MAEVLEVLPEHIEELRNLFFEKLKKDGPPPSGFHDYDINRIRHTKLWLQKFLEQFDLDMKDSLKYLWAACEWRNEYGVNELSEDNCNVEYLSSGLFFPKNRDNDGKAMFIFRSKLYVRGTQNMDDVKRCFLYFIERMLRENNDDLITIVFDTAGCGLSNIDMDFTKYIITIFKYYYPNSLNWILVYEMPWILNATFQIIKRLLPAKAVARLRFVTTKTIKDYMDLDNQLAIWGGNDAEPYVFTPEKRMNGQTPKMDSPTTMKKVTFANLSPPESPMSDKMSDFGDGEMLRVTPNDIIIFTKSETEYVGTFDITNIGAKPITYKIKTTAPEKFRVRPSTGILLSNVSATINVVLQQGHFTAWNRDKFLVMCMLLEADQPTSPAEITELWKNTLTTNAAVEQHRLKCAPPNNVIEEGFKNTNACNTNMSEADKQLLQYRSTITNLTETTRRLETQLKFNQTLQTISIGLFLLMSIVIIYILKSEIKNSASQYCMNN